MSARRRKTKDDSASTPETEVSTKAASAEDFEKKLAPVTHYLSTGCTLLDLAIADQLPGGFAAGRITQIYGDESTAKSVLVSEPLGSAQRKGGIAIMNDVEATYDLDRAEIFGVDVTSEKQWQYICSENIEQLFDEHIADAVALADETKGPCAMAIDSLSALSSAAEQDQELSDGTYGTSRAKQLSTGFRKYIGPISRSGLALLFIDQTRTKLGVTFGEKTTTSGGKALRFYASTRLRLSMVGKIKNKHDKIIGVKIGFFVRKNKVAPPFREGEFRLLFDYGIDDVASSLDWLHENDPEQAAKPKRGRPWVFADLKGRGLNSLAEKVEEAGLEKELADEVARVWREVYAPIERKPRVRLN